MMTARPTGMSVALALLTALCADATAQEVDRPSRSIQPVLSFSFTNNGQHETAVVGQQIEITLGTVGPA
jgi:hypothetical protein